MALFGKSLGNGFPIAALIGTSEAMEGAQTSFISSSYWTDGIGPAAALATLDKLDALDVRGHVARIGSHVQQAWREAATRHGLPITVQGYPCVPFFSIDHPKAAALKTLYTQAMLDRGYLASPMVYITAAHDETVLEPFAVAIDEVFADMANAIEANNIETRLRGPVCHGGFQRLI